MIAPKSGNNPADLAILVPRCERNFSKIIYLWFLMPLALIDGKFVDENHIFTFCSLNSASNPRHVGYITNKPGHPDITIEDEADEKALDEISDRSQQAGYPGDAIPAFRALR